jgi:hypothetical protein
MISQLATTVAYVTLKLALNYLTAAPETRLPKLCEAIFITNFGFLLLSIIWLYYSSDYLFKIKSSKHALTLAELLTLYSLLDIICLQQLTLLTFGAIKFTILNREANT